MTKARKHRHEEHLNHEAWAIPYGDLITLLLAFFVVMYSISSVNEGKYRTVAASLSEAFRGIPRTMVPVQVGTTAAYTADQNLNMGLLDPQQPISERIDPELELPESPGDLSGEIERMAVEIERAMADLIAEELVTVRSTAYWLEVEIQTDILFPSGSAHLSEPAIPILKRLAGVLGAFPNPIRVEGHTDNVPISTRVFPSNWELSAARAASVVHLLMKEGVEPLRLAVIGLGEYHPVESNATVEGRNRNRRVVLVIPANENLRDSLQRLHTERRADGAETPAESGKRAAVVPPMKGPA